MERTKRKPEDSPEEPSKRGTTKSLPMVIIGHVSVDENIIIDKTYREGGGGVYFAAVAAGKLGMSVSAITKCAEADIDLFSKTLEDAGVKCTFLPSEKSTSCQNYYPTTNPEDRRQKFLSLASPFEEKDLPSESPDAVVFMNALWLGEFPEALIPVVRNLKFCKYLVGDAQGFIRQIQEEGKIVRADWANKKDYLKCFDLFKIDSGEANLLCGTTDLAVACRQLGEWGAKCVIATQAESVTVFDGEGLYTAPFGHYTMIGRTGRGDTTTMAYIAAGGLWCRPEERQAAVTEAARVATAKMQYPGPFKGDDATPRANQEEKPNAPDSEQNKPTPTS